MDFTGIRSAADLDAMSPREDRRRAPRVRIAAVASMETIGGLNGNNQGLSVVRNISRTGLGIEASQPPTVKQTVILRLALDDEIHELRTQVTRVARRGSGNFHDVGLDWSQCTPEQLAFLDEILRLVEQQPLH